MFKDIKLMSNMEICEAKNKTNDRGLVGQGQGCIVYKGMEGD